MYERTIKYVTFILYLGLNGQVFKFMLPNILCPFILRNDFNSNLLCPRISRFLRPLSRLLASLFTWIIEWRKIR